jgi:hypothetical protein
MENAIRDDSTIIEESSTEMERGVNILTTSQSVIVDGAEEAIERWNKGEITAQELYDIILKADVVYVDKTDTSEFKE